MKTRLPENILLEIVPSLFNTYGLITRAFSEILA